MAGPIAVEGEQCWQQMDEFNGVYGLGAHLTWQALCARMDEALYNRLGRRFEKELGLWGASSEVHLIIIATFPVGAEVLPRVVQLSLMTATEQWLSVEMMTDKQLVDGLVRAQRSFVKLLCYGKPSTASLPQVVLTDRGHTVAAVVADDAARLLADRALELQLRTARRAQPPRD